MLMATPHQPKPKKKYILRDDLPNKDDAICCACKSFCRAGSTVTLPSGVKVQYRYCKNESCGASHKVPISDKK
jgi:hypothetical protein